MGQLPGASRKVEGALPKSEKLLAQEQPGGEGVYSIANFCLSSIHLRLEEGGKSGRIRQFILCEGGRVWRRFQER